MEVSIGYFRVLRLVSTLALASTAAAQQPSSRAPLVATWLLESIVDTVRPDSVAYWMGRHPTGAIIYTASGHVSVQFMRDPRPELPAGGATGADPIRVAGADPFRDLGASELRDLLRGYYAYFGRYRVSAAGDSIAHFVESSLRPDEVGVTYRRAIRLEGDRLFISVRAVVDGVPRHRVLAWRRAR